MRVVDVRGAKLGYVPRQYSEVVASVLDAGGVLHGEVIRQLVAPESRWVVRIYRDD